LNGTLKLARITNNKTLPHEGIVFGTMHTILLWKTGTLKKPTEIIDNLIGKGFIVMGTKGKQVDQRSRGI